ncbi:hypothetical protein C5E02_13920 [Rathayibacter rathayi]|uniref:SbsA Ig-like domain-containing protein n=1 Tax=Rathayibacter rathayi TaxID=33887 RepID=A0ABX5A8C3_RATRA|nr:hypothetical protein [Rathayibacter rathayi]PPF79236.1 hypothetical protein C5C14_09050 [Rathayibacter rathayi]PPG12656.1 hypothetical protein C5C11_09210 [Rathayibacter rathayi]PPG42620.1 hypothetical protein C5C20_09430 [Rathayibacter rathayi]PPG83780.1 hypothetical protein C5C47_14815 [Rathayibacter rathayi]PPG91948.1 hypothetical protein C5C00_14635 [Rathayibacter rathayi]
MSTEPSATEVESGGTARNGSRRRSNLGSAHASGFPRAFWAVVAVLVLAVGGLTAATVAKGPRAASLEVSTDGVVERDGGRARLHLDQAVEPDALERLTVTPDAPHTAELDGGVLTVTFTGTLRYATRYTLGIDDARSAATGSAADVSASFTTKDPDLFTLDRTAEDPSQPDAVRVRPLSGGNARVLFTADRIQDYTVVGPVLVVVTIEPDDTNILRTITLDTGSEGIIPLPGPGTVRELHSSPEKGVLGWTFTGQTPTGPLDRALYSYDLTDRTAEAVPVLGIDGGPLRASDWMFVPGTTSVVTHSLDDTVLLLDLLTPGAISPLGQHAELRGFVPGANRLVVADPDSGSLIDLADGSVEKLALPPAGVSATASPVQTLLLDSGSYVELEAEYAPGTGTTQYSVVRVDAAGPSEVFRTSPTGRIRGVCLSPNGQYLAVETVSVEGRPDDYPGEPGFGATSTVLVDLGTGDTARSVNGRSRDWCA